MDTNQKKTVEVKDCYGPRPDYFISEWLGKGNVIAWPYRPPGPCEMMILRIYYAKWARGQKGKRSEFLEATEFCLN